MTEARDAKVAHLPDAVSVKMLETTVAVLEARLEACEPYLKDGETPAQCIARNRTDVDIALSLLVAEKRRSEAAESSVQALRQALEAFVQSVSERHHWSQTGGPILVVPREAYDAARAALALPGEAAQETQE